jgi:hypothetical protein
MLQDRNHASQRLTNVEDVAYSAVICLYPFEMLGDQLKRGLTHPAKIKSIDFSAFTD